LTIPPVNQALLFSGAVRGKPSIYLFGGFVTAQYWMFFFMAVSALSLIAAFCFARQVIGSDKGIGAMQQIAGAIKEGSGVFRKHQYKTIAAILGLLLPTLASAQEQAGGGEASLVLPDLRSVTFANFFGLNGHQLL
jgi:Na+/H+-translocating membrane pyrophosphatase